MVLGSAHNEGEKGIASAFSKIKEDMERRIAEIQHLEANVQRLQDRLEERLNAVMARIDTVEASIMERQAQQNQKMNATEQYPSPMQPYSTELFIRYEMDRMRQEIRDELRRVISNTGTTQVNKLGDEMLRTVERNKKDIIKKKILSLIHEKGVELVELKDFIVDQRRYCSKASFYRYYAEMKHTGMVAEMVVGNRRLVMLPQHIKETE